MAHDTHAHALLLELSALGPSSLRLDQAGNAALRKSRTIKADTQKNRKELFDAIENKNFSELSRLIDLGVPLNILDKSRNWTKSTPLACAAAVTWPQGAIALLDAGADETLVPKHLSQSAPSGGISITPSCLEVAAIQESPDCFKLYFRRMAPVFQDRAIAHIRTANLYLALEELGEAGRMSEHNLVELAKTMVEYLNPAQSTLPHAPANKRAFESLFARLSLAANESLSRKIWHHALRGRSPAVVQALAQMNCKLPEGGLFTMVPKEHLRTHNSPEAFLIRKKAPLEYTVNNRDTSFNEEASKPIFAGMATAAFILNSYYGNYELPYALCSIEPLRKELLDNPLGIHMLSRCLHLPVHKRMAALGENLSVFLDDTGNNPLHRAAKSNESIALMESLAKLCTDWISQRDNKGQTPCECVDPRRRSQMSIAFDQIGMRDELGGKRGAKTKPASRKRL